MPYLIPYDQAVKIPDIPDHMTGDACSTALASGNDVFGASAWATGETLEGLRALGITPTIEEERSVLPVFHGMSRYTETVHYEEILSCIAYAKFDEDVSGVAYVGCNCETELWHPTLEDYFFYYTENEMRPYIWIAVCTNEIAAFVHSLYHQDENIGAWLHGLGFDLLADAEEGGE
jgi:hypothetical protein